MCFAAVGQRIARRNVECDVNEKPRSAARGTPSLQQGDRPLRKGDRVIVRLHSNWEFEGRFRGVSEGAVRIFDPAVRDTLRLRTADIALIRKAEEAL